MTAFEGTAAMETSQSQFRTSAEAAAQWTQDKHDSMYSLFSDIATQLF